MEENQRLDINQETYDAIVKLFRKNSPKLGLLDLTLSRLTNPHVTDDAGNTLLHKAVELLQQKSLDRLDEVITTLHQANVRADIKNYAGEIPAALAHDDAIRKRLFTLSYLDSLQHNPKGLALLQKDSLLTDKDMTLLTRTLNDILHDELSFLGRIKEIIRVAHHGYQESLITLCTEYNDIYRLLFMDCEPAAIYALSEADLQRKEEAIVTLVETYASTKQVITEEEASHTGIFTVEQDDPKAKAMAKADLYASRMAGFYNELGKRAADVRLIKTYYQHPGILANARALTLTLLSPENKTHLDHAYAERAAYLQEFNARRRFSYHQTFTGESRFSPTSSQEDSDSASSTHSSGDFQILAHERSNAMNMREPTPEGLQPVHNRLVIHAVKSGDIALLEILLDDGLSFIEHEKRVLDQTIDRMTAKRLTYTLSETIVEQQLALVRKTMSNPKTYGSDEDFVSRFNQIIEQTLQGFSTKLDEAFAKQTLFWIKGEKFALDNTQQREACCLILLQKAREYCQDYRMTLQNELDCLVLESILAKKRVVIQQKLTHYQPLSPSATLDARRQHQTRQDKYQRRDALEKILITTLEKKYNHLIRYYSKHGKTHFPKEYQVLFEQRDREMKTLGETFTSAKDKALLMPILEANVNPNLTESKTGESLLAIAVKQRHLETVKVLLNHHADPVWRSNGQSVLSLAMMQYNDKALTPAEHRQAEKCLHALNLYCQRKNVDTRQVLGLQLDKQMPVSEELLSLFNWAQQEEFAPLRNLLAILEELKKKLDGYGQSYLDRQNLPFFTRLRNGYYRDDLQIHRGETLVSSYESLGKGIKELHLDSIQLELESLKRSMRDPENSQLYKAIDETLQKLVIMDTSTRDLIKRKQRELLERIGSVKNSLQKDATYRQEIAEKNVELRNSYQQNEQLSKTLLQKDSELSKANAAITELKSLKDQAETKNAEYELKLENKNKLIIEKDEAIEALTNSKVNLEKVSQIQNEKIQRLELTITKHEKDMENQKIINEEQNAKIEYLEKLIKFVLEEKQGAQQEEKKNSNNQENAQNKNKDSFEDEQASRPRPK